MDGRITERLRAVDPSVWFLAAVTLLALPPLLWFWSGDDIHSLGFLVLPWALWAVLRTPRAEPRAEGWRVAAFVAAAGLAIVGWRIDATTLSLWSVVAALAVVALERGAPRIAWLPIGLLLLTVPPPGFDWFLLQSQLAVAALSEGTLQLLGTPVERNSGGFLLQAPIYSYSVEPLCTGLSGILATVALVGMTTYHLLPPKRRALMALTLGVLATIVFNVVRIVALVLITESEGPKYIQSAFHETTSLVMSLAAFAITIPFLLRKGGTDA